MFVSRPRRGRAKPDRRPPDDRRSKIVVAPSLHPCDTRGLHHSPPIADWSSSSAHEKSRPPRLPLKKVLRGAELQSGGRARGLYTCMSAHAYTRCLRAPARPREKAATTECSIYICTAEKSRGRAASPRSSAQRSESAKWKN